MFKSFLLCTLLFLGTVKGASQTATSSYAYRHPSEVKESWQRLLLYQSALSFYTLKQGDIYLDSSFVYVSQSLGMSRLSVAAEGIDDPELLAQSKWFDQRDTRLGLRLLSQTKGKRHLQQLVLLGAYFTFEPNRATKRDSAIYYLNKALNENKSHNDKKLRRIATCLLGKALVQGGDTAKGNATFNQLILECLKEGDKKTAARALGYWGMFSATDPNNKDAKLNYLERARVLYKDVRYAEGEIIMLTRLGYFYLGRGHLDDAYKAFLDAGELQKSIGFPYSHYNSDDLTMVTMLQGKFGEPLKYALETVKSAERARDSVGWGPFYTRLGGMYITEGGREEEGIKWMVKAIDRYVADRDPDLYLTLFTVVSSMVERGKPGEAYELIKRISQKVQPNLPNEIYYNMSFATVYMGLKEYRKAEEFALKADSVLKVFASIPELAVVKDYLGKVIAILSSQIYFESGKYSKAKKILQPYLNTASDLTLLENDMVIYKQMIQLDSVFKDDASAVKHYRQYVQLLDSNFRVSKVRQAEELQVMYETEEKEAEIALLNQQARLEQANLKQATLVRNFTIGGIAVALLIAALLYRQSRLRHGTNKVITQKNKQLEHLLTEKEWLLKEIHHRVKNNLQIVMSLLDSQAAYIENPNALSAIHDSQHRVHAMSLIHQKLYGSDNVSSIDMNIYIRELAIYLKECFPAGRFVHFNYQIEPIVLDVSQAVPLGLIMNEAITNSLKYAFPDGKSGVISITLMSTKENHYELSIADNGIGFSADYTIPKKGSLGMSLMQGLSEELRGNLVIENRKGTRIKLSFTPDYGVKRSSTRLTSSSLANPN